MLTVKGVASQIWDIAKTTCSSQNRSGTDISARESDHPTPNCFRGLFQMPYLFVFPNPRRRAQRNKAYVHETNQSPFVHSQIKTNAYQYETTNSNKLATIQGHGHLFIEPILNLTGYPEIWQCSIDIFLNVSTYGRLLNPNIS